MRKIVSLSIGGDLQTMKSTALTSVVTETLRGLKDKVQWGTFCSEQIKTAE